jgi:uncharacterized protein (DUF1697 family)
MTHVAFLRAVNLGRRRVKMSSLVELTRGLGYSDVWTHINSGNVIFEASGTRAALEHRLETVFEADLGFEVTTFVRTAVELRRALALKPFKLASDDTYFVTFLKDIPTRPKAEALELLSNEFDTLVVKGRDVHWRMRGKSIDTKLTTKAWDEIVGHHRSTSRNTNMLRTLLGKLDAKN